MNLHVDFPHEGDKQRWISFPLTMFEELTLEPRSFVYLISLLCWRKPKWKWHHFPRICNSSELKTTRPAKHVILSLRGWARYPQEQTGLSFVFVWACVCVFEWACLGRCAATKTPQQHTRRGKQMSTFSFFHVDKRASICPCSFSAGESVCT